MSDISGTGTIVRLRANITYPVGIPVTQWADDTDPLDSAVIDIAATAMGVNGNLVTWGNPVVIPLVLAVIPNSIDDLALAALLENNRVGKLKLRTRDIISADVIYPNLGTVSLSGGAIISGPVMNSIASAGRLKSKVYTFHFENKGGINVPGF